MYIVRKEDRAKPFPVYKESKSALLQEAKKDLVYALLLFPMATQHSRCL